MGYFSGSATQRQQILDKARAQISAGKDDELLAAIDLSNWDEAFDMLNEEYWGGSLRKIPVFMVHNKKKWYGLFSHSGKIQLNSRYKLSALEYLGVLLHEMCHHWVEEKYGHGVSAANGSRVIGHGKEWKREMRRVGYRGKISRFSGKERFLSGQL